MLDLLGLGDLTTTIAVALGTIITAALALWGARRSGAAEATAKRDAADAAEYIAERTRQDAKNVGHGATDLERIGMLEAIRDRKRTGKN